MDADGLTFACAMTVEERIARRFGQTAVVGLGASKGVPEGRLVSFGIAGALSSEFPVGTVIDATRVVDESGAVLWEGGPLGASPARTGTILGASRIVDDPAERARLHAHTGADAVDMESGALARSGRLVGCLRATCRSRGAARATRRRTGSAAWPRERRRTVRSTTWDSCAALPGSRW